LLVNNISFLENGEELMDIIDELKPTKKSKKQNLIKNFLAKPKKETY